MRGFAIRQAELCCILFADGASVDLFDGEITNNYIGACVHIEGYDLNRLFNGVLYRDNRINVETAGLPPAPDPPPFPIP
jgi:hypothetical protein